MARSKDSRKARLKWRAAASQAFIDSKLVICAGRKVLEFVFLYRLIYFNAAYFIAFVELAAGFLGRDTQ